MEIGKKFISVIKSYRMPDHLRKIIFPVLFAFSFSCSQENKAQQNVALPERNDFVKISDDSGTTILTRFLPPQGYERIPSDKNSFAQWLLDLPLKPAGSKVYYYDGRVKQHNVYDGVLSMDIGQRDLQQCADAAIRLRAEYLFAQKKYDAIIFHFTSGFPVPYSKWKNGYRLRIQGNICSWVLATPSDNSYKSFRQYLDLVFSYAGTLSLQKELKQKHIADIQPGDVFIHGGSPGHAVIVIDVAVNAEGKRIFMLAQSYMPAQDIHILKNESQPVLSPWYESDVPGDLITPEWVFSRNELGEW